MKIETLEIILDFFLTGALWLPTQKLRLFLSLMT